MDDYFGIACGHCDTFSPLDTEECPGCGRVLSLAPQGGEAAPSEPVRAQAPKPDDIWETDRATASPEEPMEQARNFVCKECSSPVPSGHKFCGACGAGVPDLIQHPREEYFGAMQAPGKARLILIRGDQGVDGLSYLLQGAEHVAGRQDGQILFPEDKWLSPRHANFIYRGEKLVLRDEGSVNGVYVRLRGAATLEPGSQFLCGEQIFRVDPTPKDTSGPDPDQTYFYSSPKRPSPFRLTQVLVGGTDGMTVCAREEGITVGRENCDLNFPDDIYMSAQHAQVAPEGGKLQLTDTGSRNGTFVRIKGEQELAHGDYLFLGHQLLRVEMTA